MPKRLQTYETPAMAVTFDPNRCTHSGQCVRGLPAVFDIRRNRWIRPELAPPADVAAQVARCPSGALQVRWPGRPPEEPAPELPNEKVAAAHRRFRTEDTRQVIRRR